MFKISEHEQNTPEWFNDRLAKWTASIFCKAITPTGKPSASADDVNNRLVAEKILGRPDETFQSEAMLRGKELEDDALRFLNFTHDMDFKKCGFVDSGLGYGCSPDALDLGQEIGLELKCPSAHTHIEYISNGTLPDKYKAQVQGGMLVTGFKKWVFFSYHPEIRSFMVVVERDEKYIESMREILLKNCEEVTRKYKLLTEYLKD